MQQSGRWRTKWKPNLHWWIIVWSVYTNTFKCFITVHQFLFIGISICCFSLALLWFPFKGCLLAGWCEYSTWWSGLWFEESVEGGTASEQTLGATSVFWWKCSSNFGMICLLFEPGTCLQLLGVLVDLFLEAVVDFGIMMYQVYRIYRKKYIHIGCFQK